MSRRLVYWADRYVCDATPCLTVAIRAAGARLGVDPAEIEAVMPYAIVRIRESFHES